jgi:phosphatidylinositol 3-kinase
MSIKFDQKQAVKRTDDLRTLCNFMKNISLEWDVDEAQTLSTWYIDSYFNNLIQRNSPDQLQERYNAILLHTLSLWDSVYSFCPIIKKFNIKVLHLTHFEVVVLLLPQLLFVLRHRVDARFETLVTRVIREIKYAIDMFWILVVEMEQEAQQRLANPLMLDDPVFAPMIYFFLSRLTSTDTGLIVRETLKHQGNLIEKLVEISGKVNQARLPVSGKKKMLRAILKDSPDLLLFDPIVLPIKKDIKVIGLIPEQCSVFQSQMNPLLLTFLTKEGGLLKCIFKSGDDLRQDALVSRLLKIIVWILRENGISDDSIVTYEVVTTGCCHGFVEHVKSNSLDNVLQRPEGLSYILRNEDGKLDAAKMHNFVDSTAYYTVFTYLLCVGDRHLDNILITDQGHLFHVDYGFLAREPKPFAPAVKLCPEIIDIMGGKYSGYYGTFLRRCITCYLILRKNAHVILDCIMLTMDAGITDVNLHTLSKIKQRFCLNTSDEDAIQMLTNNIEKGFETIIPQMLDSFHHTWKVVQGGCETHDDNENLLTDHLDDWTIVEME